ncbi:MAG: hypothetical protein AAF962_15005 [Actinomycetota bacterium]
MTTTQFDFANEEWELIASAPVIVGYAVARAEDSGFVGSLRETRTLVASIAAGAEDNPARSLIDGATTTEVRELMKEYGSSAPEYLADTAVEVCTRLVPVLGDTATTEESVGYRRWVLEVARSVAEAAREHRVRVSEPEADLLARVADALDLS